MSFNFSHIKTVFDENQNKKKARLLTFWERRKRDQIKKVHWVA